MNDVGNIVPKFLNGGINPIGTDGEDGDMFINITSGDLFGPKVAGAWGAAIGNLRGPAGGQQYDQLHIDKTNSNLSTYSTLGYYLHPGTDVTGAVEAIKLIAQNSGGTENAFRIWDNTNSAVIVEVLNQSFTSVTVLDMGTPGTVSSAEALWEIQTKGVGSSDQTVFNFNVEYFES